MPKRLKKRHGAEVFVNKSGEIVIKQDLDGYPGAVAFKPCEIPDLIEELKARHSEALEFVIEDNN